MISRLAATMCETRSMDSRIFPIFWRNMGVQHACGSFSSFSMRSARFPWLTMSGVLRSCKNCLSVAFVSEVVMVVPC